ncbi:MAG: glutamine--tRNA ligase/YqeY domain fusion protein [Burkholderiales bacterium]|nr:glutamine--tRNA ligase/YqeY domain fusion protein [Burkholderiales bacterium]
MSTPAKSGKPPPSAPPASNFIRAAIDADLAAGKYAARRWSGRPGPAASHAGAPPDAAQIRTRFPPEPNGYLHIGHAKAICLNFGLALDYGGACHLRYDDTNPEKEEQEYVDAIADAVKWLGFDWGPHRYFASDYFDTMYDAAEYLIEHGHAYVDSQSAEEMRAARGTLTGPGRDSPCRTRSPAENLRLFREMRGGRHPEGSHVLRAKIDMASPNINLRDPAIYRIRMSAHHRTGDRWCVYPMYAYAHPIEDALERITHSLCTLEFEDQRPFYDWLLERLAEGGFFARPLPRQIEFARLNLTYVVLSKRRLVQLVEEGHVEGWDDPRMPTLAGARRRGYTPQGFRRFAERIGVSKADSWIEYSVLEECMREHLNEVAPRRMAVLDPVKLVIENYPEGKEERCEIPNHPQKPERGGRQVPFSRELWIEREDFTESPPGGYFRLFPGNRVRLRYGYVVECTGYDAATDTVRCSYDPDTKSGTPGAEKVKVKGNIHWVSARHAFPAEVRLFDRLFRAAHPGRAPLSPPSAESPPAQPEGQGGWNGSSATGIHDSPPPQGEGQGGGGGGEGEPGESAWLRDLNPDSRKVIVAQLEPALRDAGAEERFQFERHGYFVADRVDSAPGAPKFNRAVTLRDSWTR